jgi:hypothetical protein
MSRNTINEPYDKASIGIALELAHHISVLKKNATFRIKAHKCILWIKKEHLVSLLVSQCHLIMKNNDAEKNMMSLALLVSTIKKPSTVKHFLNAVLAENTNLHYLSKMNMYLLFNQ